MKLLIMQSPLVVCFLILNWPKYLSQHPVLQHPTFVPPSMRSTKFHIPLKHTGKILVMRILKTTATYYYYHYYYYYYYYYLLLLLLLIIIILIIRENTLLAWRRDSCVDIVYSMQHIILILQKTSHFHIQRDCCVLYVFLCK